MVEINDKTKFSHTSTIGVNQLFIYNIMNRNSYIIEVLIYLEASWNLIFSCLESNTPCPSTPVKHTPVASLVDNLLKFPPRSQIMPLRPKNECVFQPGHKETLSPVVFGKIGGPHWYK